MADIFSTAVAAWEAAEAIFRVGEELIARYKAYQHADERIKELVLIVEVIWAKTTHQMNLLSDLAKTKTIPQRLYSIHEKCFEQLHDHLQLALRKLSTLTGKSFRDGINVSTLSIQTSKWQRLKYSALEKHLNELIDVLDRWQRVFDPSWYLIARIEDRNVDVLVNADSESSKQGPIAIIRQIRQMVLEQREGQPSKGQRPIFIEASSISAGRTTLCPTKLQLSAWNETGESVLVDTTKYPDGSDSFLTTNFVRALANFLSTSQITSLHLPQCLGVVKVEHTESSPLQYQYMFALPVSNAPPVSLRATLMCPAPSLDARMNIARGLARAVTSLHAADFVHKNIRPETVILFEDNRAERSIPFLVGYQSLRPSQGHSSLKPDMVWEHNLYRHPGVQGLEIQEYYKMQHDIYSLGVSLLEIGLWKSFVEYDSHGTARPSPSMPIAELLNLASDMQKARAFKSLLTSQARNELPSRMGWVYTEIVVASLTCLDDDAHTAFTSLLGLDDDAGLDIGVAFIEAVLTRLESITLKC